MLIAEAARSRASSAATLFFDVWSDAARPDMLEAGFTLTEFQRMSDRQILSVLRYACRANVRLDYHAPWLSRQVAEGFIYPTPLSDPALFDRLLDVARMHQSVFDERPQLTIHMAGASQDWQAWVERAREVAEVIAENAFVMRPAEVPAGESITDGGSYYRCSDCHAPQEFISWVKAVGLNGVCFDQGHALIGYRHENGGRFDPLGDLRFLEKIMDAGLRVARFHRAYAPRDLAGRLRSETVGRNGLNSLDGHMALQPFTRAWFLQQYPDEAAFINRIFDRLRTGYPDDIPVTFEIWPHFATSCQPRDFLTVFS
jgi:hypothetical protein